MWRTILTAGQGVPFMLRRRERPSLKINHPSMVAPRGLYLKPLLQKSLQPICNPPMVWCRFQNKCDPQLRKANPMAFLVMEMYLYLSSSYIILRFMEVIRYNLSRLQMPQRNVKLLCIHLLTRGLVIPLMSLILARDSKPFKQRQSNGESKKKPSPIMKMILLELVELKSKEIAITNFLPM